MSSSFFSSRFVSVEVVHPYNSIDTTTAWKKLRLILSVRSDFHMTDGLSIAVHIIFIFSYGSIYVRVNLRNIHMYC